MDLGGLLDRKGNKKEYYWALVIEPGWLQAGIWEIIGDKADVVAVSPPAPWESDEEMVGACDTVLSAAIQTLPEEGVEPTKTVFGVAPSWVSEGQISEEYLLKIKKVCSELSLEPSGFVVLPEAIAHLTKFEEGSPLNAVVLGVGDEELDLAVFRLGSLVGTTTVARSVSIADDVAEGLTRFAGTEPLPSRFLIYDGKEGELEENRQALLAFDWTAKEKIKFLHTPKIEIVSPDKKVLATALAGASEISKVSGIVGVKKEEEKPVEEEPAKEIPPTQVAPSELGFAIGEDVAKTKAAPMAEENVAPPTPPVPVTGPAPRLAGVFDKVSTAKNTVLRKFQLPSFGEPGGRKTLTMGLSFLAILFLASFGLWWYYPKADVTIYVSGKQTEEKAAIFVDTKAQGADISKFTIPGEMVKTSVSGDKTKSTSGTKTIGDKAKGTVKIENGTSDAINFPAGTIIAASSDLRFTTNQAASVSAALSPGSPGTGTVDVTAADIGADYNLGKDESFKVGNYPKAEVDAVATANFSGGSSRQISAVSADDQKSLVNDEEEELLTKAKEELLSSLPSDRFLIQESSDATASATLFSAKVGDEASTLKLTLSLDATAISISKPDLYNLAAEVMKGKVPSGFVLRNEQLSFSFEPKGQKGSIYEFEMTVASNLLPEIKPDTIAKNISGKYPDSAETYLSTIPGFHRVEFRIKPRLPGRLGTLPRIPTHISVEIVAEK